MKRDFPTYYSLFTTYYLCCVQNDESESVIPSEAKESTANEE